MQRRSVVKFGGTSVKTASAINQAISIIENNHSIRAIVVSAVGGVTNKLLEFSKVDFGQRHQILLEIKEIHLDLLKELTLSDQLSQIVTQIIEKLQKFCDVTLTMDLIDEILSLGEQLSSLIVYHALKRNNNAVTLVDAKQFMITDNHFGKATPDLYLIKERCQAMLVNLPENNMIVTQGFIGATVDGIPTTLGRGGSDYSAALLAESINADSLFIYTDVKGVYTMDPNIVPNAQLIAQMSFQEMAELANFGAKILHPATLAPCVRSQIPVMILSTFEPAQGFTCILPDNNFVKKSVIRAIAIRKKQILVTIRSLNMLNASGFLAKVFSILASHKISVDLITTSEVSVALTVDGTNLGSHEINPFTGELLLNELASFSEVTMEDNLTLVTVVGSGLTIPGVSQTILGKVIEYSIRLICYGASSSNLGFLVATSDSHAVVSKLHKEFIETKIEGDFPILNRPLLT